MKNKKTTLTFRKKKESKEKITMLTAYDYPTAKLLDECGVDSILVGDSLGMVVLGYDDTTKVTMDDMTHHTKAVARGVKNALVIADMPFLSYHLDINEAVRNAGKLVQAGAGAVKLEGGKEILDVIKAITRANVPVVGHLGLTPQSVHMTGGFFVQNKTVDTINELIDNAKALEEAGVFAIVLECVPYTVAKLVTESVNVPTIGIGAGSDTDGQVLVINDLAGYYHGNTAKFVKQYANIKDDIELGVKKYIDEVKNKEFPEIKHSFELKKEVSEELKSIGDGDVSIKIY
ncbi:3-methyl-2-oxobutanoate hydroxymethyltransferase [Mycoplasmatota bacterium WC44]